MSRLALKPLHYQKINMNHLMFFTGLLGDQEKMIERGDKNEERLYLKDAVIGDTVFKKTFMLHIDEIIQRHKARYMLAAFFVRKGMKVLDFPCGSGYFSDIIKQFGVYYEGRDYDRTTLEFCRHFYSGTFIYGDLTNPDLCGLSYNLIACIEGIEHIEHKYQSRLIEAFYGALKPNGILVISSPVNPDNVSGPSKFNPYHKWELGKGDFYELLMMVFNDVQIIKTQEVLHNRRQSECLYGICRK